MSKKGTWFFTYFILILLVSTVVINYILQCEGITRYENEISLAIYVIIIILLLSLSRELDYGSRFLFTPIGVLIGLYFFYFPINFLFLMEVEHSYFSLAYASIGIASFLFGVVLTLTCCNAGKTCVELRLKNENRDKNGVLVVYFLGLIGTVFSISTGNFFGQYEVTNKFISPILGVSNQLRFLGYAAFAAFFIRSPSKKIKILFYFSFVVEILLAFLTTSKQLIIFPILVALMCRAYFGAGMPSLKIIVSALVVFSLFVVTYAVRGIFYTYIGDAQISLVDIVKLFSAIPQALASISKDELFLLAQKVVERFHGLHSLNLILETQTPDNYYNYSGFRYFIALLVPRVFWAEKPDADYQIMFGHEFYGIQENLRVLIPPTQIGVMMLDFGVWGVAFFQCLIGVLTAAMTIWGRKNTNDFSVLNYMLFIYLFFQLTKIEAHPAEILSATLKSTPLLIIVIYFSRALTRLNFKRKKSDYR